MTDASNELTLRFLSVTLSAKGPAALWLVIPVSALLIAVAWRIAGRKM